MEFVTLDKMIEELEKEKTNYVKVMESRIQKIKDAIEKMKEEYRNETIPEANDMVEYMIAKGKERLGKDLVQASDIPKDLLEDFYEAMDRKVDIKRIVMKYQLEGKFNTVYHFFFTDSTVYLWGHHILGSGCSIYPYKDIQTIKVGEKSNGGLLACTQTIERDAEVIFNRKIQENERINLEKVLTEIADKNLVRLLLDLRDYADRE